MDNLLKYMFLTLPECIFMVLCIITILRIRKGNIVIILSVIYTSIIMSLSSSYSSLMPFNVLASILLLSLLYKGMFNYNIPWKRYLKVVFIIDIIMIVAEVVICFPVVMLSGVDTNTIAKNILILSLISVPLRAIEFGGLYIYYYWRKAHGK